MNKYITNFSRNNYLESNCSCKVNTVKGSNGFFTVDVDNALSTRKRTPCPNDRKNSCGSCGKYIL